MSHDSPQKNYFTSGSQEYASFRPRYPDALGEFLSSVSPMADQALDCACGNGQLSVVLAKAFREVTAIDSSASQINQAEARENITYRLARAEDLTDLPDASFDLITVAQAAHWFELHTFYQQATRLLKPHGVLAMLSYAALKIHDTPCDKILQAMNSAIFATAWPINREDVDSGYAGWDFPFDEFPLPAMELRAEWNFSHLTSYIRTWSAFRVLEDAGRTEEITPHFQALQSAWGNALESKTITWPLRGRIGKKPQHAPARID